MCNVLKTLSRARKEFNQLIVFEIRNSVSPNLKFEQALDFHEIS